MKKREKLLAGLLAGVLCLALAGCGAANMASGGAAADGEEDYKGKNFSYMADTAPEALFDSAVSESVGQTDTGSGTVYQSSEVKLIRRANLTVQTTEFDKAVAALDALVTEMGGYYESSELNSGSYYNQNSNRSGNYTVRIPAEKYDAFMAQVDGIGYLARKNESSEDVGEIYYDLEARLKTQRTKQERLLDLLKLADSVEDIIALESALTDVEYQIEQYSSELNRYDGLIGFSTVRVTLNEMIRIVDEPGERASVFTRMKAGVVSSANALVTGVQDLLIWVSYHLFGLLVSGAAVAAGVVFGRKYIKVRKAIKKAQPGEEGKEE